jgi:RimJ/RimL family protein N-acetyltransferase
LTTINRLSLPRDRFALETHFAALGTEDLCNRFGHSIKPEAVTKYLDQWSAAGIPSYGIFDPDGRLIAVSQLAQSADELEVGLSVLPTYRRKGLALALLYGCARYARTRGLKSLIIHCLTDNMPMLSLARRIGMTIEISNGETAGHLTLRAATAIDFWSQIADDQESLAKSMADFVVKSWQLAAKTALRNVPPTKDSGT